MRPNYAQDAPPTSIEVGGFAYPCETDFLVWLDALKQLKALNLRDDSPEALKALLSQIEALEVTVFGGRLADENPFEALAAISRFSQGYPAAPVEGGRGSEPVYSFDYDLNDIVIAIRNQHGVDLSYRRTETCHWWEFLLLFRTLAGAHYILNVMDARGYQGKDKALLKRKQAVALPPEYTAEERAELDAFNALFSGTTDEEVSEHDQN